MDTEPPSRITTLDISIAVGVLSGNRIRVPLFLDSLDDIMDNPLLWAKFSEHDTQQVLIGLYMARRRRMQ